SERILYRGVREANASFTAAFAKRTHPLPRRSRSERILFTAAFAKRTQSSTAAFAQRTQPFYI
ncbi:MAG TPA: hypothetical protein VFA29_12345, partial [Candidatus Baltobacteraceae bacterium]|nr:hypothetical protein [Candidatus Baltobacteraceae bacterium]